MSSACFEPLSFILRKTVVNTIFIWYVYVQLCALLAGGRVNTEHTLPPARLFT